MVSDIEENCLILSHVNQPYYDYHINEFRKKFNLIENFKYMEYFHNNGLKAMENEILKIIDEEQITYLIVWQWYTNYVPRLEFLQKLRKKVFVVLWLFDDDVFFHSHGKFYAQACDAVVTTDYFGKIMYEQLNIPSVYYASSFDKLQYKPISIEKDIDVSFVGGVDKADRREYIEFLKKNGIRVESYGSGSKNGYVTFDEMVLIFNRSKINLNFTKIAFSNSLHESNPLIARLRQNKGRPIEIGLTKSFLLCENAAPLKYIFDIEKDMDTFKDKEELVEKIKYYLSNYQEAEKKANSLYIKSLNEYETDIYIPKIFEELELIRSNKDFLNIDCYPIERNGEFLKNEMAFFLYNGIRFLVKKRSFTQASECIKQTLKYKKILILNAMFFMFKKHSIGESK